MLRLSRALVCAALLCVLSNVCFAQEPAPTSTPVAPAAQPAHVEVTLTGGKGRAVPELTREDVRVFVDGVERPVVSFEKETQPVSYGLVVDNSASLRSQMARVVSAAKFVVTQNAPGDEAFVVRFVASDQISVLQNFTADKAALNAAFDSMFVQGGQTALLDALHLAGEHLTKKAKRDGAPGRRLALILVSDGEDRQSWYKAEQVFKLLKAGGVQVFCVGLTGELDDVQGFINKGRRQRAKDLLLKIADETGGRVFYAEKGGELEDAVGDVVRDMRARYVVGYTPPEPGGKGNGKVEVKLVGAPAKEKLKAITRQKEAEARP
ncbi:MAG: VWA domain-containing protein [Pyrinomonadaceae bacterium]